MLRRNFTTPTGMHLHASSMANKPSSRKRKKTSLAARFELTKPKPSTGNLTEAGSSTSTGSAVTTKQGLSMVKCESTIGNTKRGLSMIRCASTIGNTSAAKKQKTCSSMQNETSFKMSSCSSPLLGAMSMLRKVTSSTANPNNSNHCSEPPSCPAMPHLNKNLQGKESISIDRLHHINPLHFVESCFKAYNIKTEVYDSLSKKDFFLDITESSLAAYQADVIRAIRNCDIEALREVKNSGRSLQGCNRFGESFMHIACRRGSPDVLKFLITDGECKLRVHDDYGRTPLHDACWQAEPNFELIDIVLDAEPDLLLLKDKRGNTALEYVRREHWGVWIKYLSHRMKIDIKRRLDR